MSEPQLKNCILTDPDHNGDDNDKKIAHRIN